MKHFESKVIDLASDGRGVVKHPDGSTVFVEGVWPEELAKFRITGSKGSVKFGELVELLTPAPVRQNAPCPHHGLGEKDCGGCPWQYIHYDAQLTAKQSKVESAFSRLGMNTVEKIIPSPNTLGYRNRAQFKTDGKNIGFVRAKSHQLAPIQQCLILTEKNQHTLTALQARLPVKEWQPTHKKQRWCTLDIDENTHADDVSVNQRLPFLQANDAQNTFMKQWLHVQLKQLAEQKKSLHILELFCGAGNFTEVMAPHAESIFGVEVADNAIEELNKKSLSNVSTFITDIFAEDAFEKIYRRCGDVNTLVLDPPRDGLKNKAGLISKKIKFKDIFYISCDLATLTRDIKFFQENRFMINSVQPVDQFPHTPHIETLVHLTRK